VTVWAKSLFLKLRSVFFSHHLFKITLQSLTIFSSRRHCLNIFPRVYVNVRCSTQLGVSTVMLFTSEVLLLVLIEFYNVFILLVSTWMKPCAHGQYENSELQQQVVSIVSCFIQYETDLHFSIYSLRSRLSDQLFTECSTDCSFCW